MNLDGELPAEKAKRLLQLIQARRVPQVEPAIPLGHVPARPAFARIGFAVSLLLDALGDQPHLSMAWRRNSGEGRLTTGNSLRHSQGQAGRHAVRRLGRSADSLAGPLSLHANQISQVAIGFSHFLSRFRHFFSGFLLSFSGLLLSLFHFAEDFRA